MSTPLTCSAELLLPHSVRESNYTNTILLVAAAYTVATVAPPGKLIFASLPVPGSESRLKIQRDLPGSERVNQHRMNLLLFKRVKKGQKR